MTLSQCANERRHFGHTPGVQWGMRCVLLLLASIALGQNTSFDAASVRKAAPPSGEVRRSPRIAATPGGVTVRGANLRDCIQWAWGLREYQLHGPDWMTFETYDISTRTGGPAREADLRAMMRTLLVDRFQLKLRAETRELPALVLAAGRNPAKLTASAHAEQSMTRLPGGGLRLEFRRTSIAQLAEFLSTLAAVDQPVEDRSGLDGVYDFRLDLHEAVGPWASDAERLAAPSIATVVQEQLGLRLEGRKLPIEVFVVERVERPSEN